MVKLPNTKLTVLNIYRPPDTSRGSQPFATFLSEVQSTISEFATVPHHFVITGDFNIHVDDPSDSHARQFSEILSSLNLTQHVTFPTHSLGHTLDLAITASDSTLQPSVSSSPLSPSDHLPIFTALDIDQLPVPPPPAQRSFRRLAAINTENFTSDISHSVLITNPPSSLPELLECYNKTLSSILDKLHSGLTRLTHPQIGTLTFQSLVHASPSHHQMCLSNRRESVEKNSLSSGLALSQNYDPPIP